MKFIIGSHKDWIGNLLAVPEDGTFYTALRKLDVQHSAGLISMHGECDCQTVCMRSPVRVFDEPVACSLVYHR